MVFFLDNDVLYSIDGRFFMFSIDTTMQRSTDMKKMTLWAAMVLVAAWTMADVTLDPVFTSNMMLQQGAPIAFFGKAPAEKDITATFGDETVTVKSDAQGKWRAVFAPKKAGKETLFVVET